MRVTRESKKPGEMGGVSVHDKGTDPDIDFAGRAISTTGEWGVVHSRKKPQPMTRSGAEFSLGTVGTDRCGGERKPREGARTWMRAGCGTHPGKGKPLERRVLPSLERAL